MDDEMTTELRTVTFSEARKGFDKEEVRRFLAEVSRWIEGGGGDVVRRRLERIANKSAQMLADAEDGAEGLRREAEHEAREMIDTARTEADAYRAEAETEARVQLRDARAEATASREAATQYATETTTKADQYASDTTTRADDYAEQTRLEAKRESDELLEEAAQQAKQAVRGAEQRAEQLIAEANRQREAIETVIGDLIQERDAVVANVRKLARELVETAGDVVSEAATVRSAVSSEESEPPQLEPIDRGEPAEDLGADSAPVRRRNGSPAV